MVPDGDVPVLRLISLLFALFDFELFTFPCFSWEGLLKFSLIFCVRFNRVSAFMSGSCESERFGASFLGDFFNLAGILQCSGMKSNIWILRCDDCFGVKNRAPEPRDFCASKNHIDLPGH